MALKILIISDYFEPHVENELYKYVKDSYNKSGLLYEDNIYKGFVEVAGIENVTMMCVPTCGTFPNTSRLLFSPEFSSRDQGLKYVKFCNVIYYRNVSRFIHLKHKIKRYLKSIKKDDELIVLVIQMHEPFMKTIKYIKSKHNKTKSCLNIWDFPDMMNDSNLKGIKKYLKRGNNNRTYKLLNDFDMFFYLCDGMREKVNPIAPNRPFIIHEGIISKEQMKKYNYNNSLLEKKIIVYTGKLTQKDGVLDLISAVKQMDKDNIELHIAGGGEIYDEMIQLINNNKRIYYHGVLNRDETLELQKKADLFVVPRLVQNYTSYSFPSKVIEYILAGKPILAHKLKCFNDNLDGVLTYIPDNGNESLLQAIMEMVDGDIKMDMEKRERFIKHNMNTNIAGEIIHVLIE